jgi:hypothetical protein
VPGPKLAIKQLSSSDLSLFRAHLRKSKQKGINLNSDVFVHTFFPALKGLYGSYPFQLSIHGPGARAVHLRPQQKAWRTSGKNWRLDGALVDDPPGERGRYDDLRHGDFAILGFQGTRQPEGDATLILVSATDDAALHAAIRSKFAFAGRQTMRPVSPEDLDDLWMATRGAYGRRHPLRSLLIANAHRDFPPPDTVEEAVFGSARTQERIARTNGQGAAITQDTVRQQLRAAEDTGEQGEAAFNHWLLATGHEERDYVWLSRTHARAARDFDLNRPRWKGATGELFIDVKATRGRFDSPIHMSMAEVRWAASHANYRIARIHELTQHSARLTMLSGVQTIAERILAAITGLPDGLAVDGFEIDTSHFTRDFSTELDLPDE